MSYKLQVKTITGASPSATGSAVIGTPIASLAEFDWFTLDFQVACPSGSTLDLVLQRKIPDPTVDLWVDWIRLPQLTSSQSKAYTVQAQPLTAVTAVGTGATSTGITGATLAANTSIGGHPGDKIRLVGTTPNGVTGVNQTVYVTCWKRDV